MAKILVKRPFYDIENTAHEFKVGEIIDIADRARVLNIVSLGLGSVVRHRPAESRGAEAYIAVTKQKEASNDEPSSVESEG